MKTINWTSERRLEAIEKLNIDNHIMINKSYNLNSNQIKTNMLTIHLLITETSTDINKIMVDK